MAEPDEMSEELRERIRLIEAEIEQAQREARAALHGFSREVPAEPVDVDEIQHYTVAQVEWPDTPPPQPGIRGRLAAWRFAKGYQSAEQAAAQEQEELRRTRREQDREREQLGLPDEPSGWDRYWTPD
jgi:hypothetical protein